MFNLKQRLKEKCDNQLEHLIFTVNLKATYRWMDREKEKMKEGMISCLLLLSVRSSLIVSKSL